MNKNNVKQLKNAGDVLNMPPENKKQDLLITFDDVVGYTDNGDNAVNHAVFETKLFEDVKAFSISSHWVNITQADDSSMAFPYARIRSIQHSYKD